MMASISFTSPQYLWAFVTLPILIAVHLLTFNYIGSRAFEFANFPALLRVSKSFKIQKNILPLMIRILALTLIIFAVSGTTLWYSGVGSDFDFVLAIDASSSMLTKDYPENRLEAAKKSALIFADNVPPESKIGLITFAGTSFIKQNLAEDKFLLRHSIRNIGAETAGGTDLGNALVTSTNMLSGSERARSIVLLTDGRSNVGLLLDDALDYVKNNHVNVHTIGIGTEEGGLFENVTEALKIDEESLKRISEETGGLYFRAEDKAKLEDAYKEIAKQTEKQVSLNLTVILLLAAVGFSLLDWALMNTKYKRIP